MKVTTQSVHCSSEGKPICEISLQHLFPLITISNRETNTVIYLFPESITDLVNFKNTVLNSFEETMRNLGYDK